MDTEEVKEVENLDDNNKDEDDEEGEEAPSLAHKIFNKLLNEHEQRGIEYGKQQGIVLGEAMAFTEVAQKLLRFAKFSYTISYEDIADICKLSLARVEELAAK